MSEHRMVISIIYFFLMVSWASLFSIELRYGDQKNKTLKTLYWINAIIYCLLYLAYAL